MKSRKRLQHDDAFTCVYSQPGCQIDILPSTWRERAKETLEHYKSHLAEEGMRYQGCCCGHTHLNLPDEGVALLRNAGFLVEAR